MRKKMLAFLVLSFVLGLSFTGIIGCQADEVAVDPDKKVEEKDTYPDQPMTWIIPFSPGGAFERSARVYQPHFEKEFGVTQLMECRGGALTQIGHQVIRDAATDGYTLGFLAAPHMFVTMVEHGADYTLEDFAPMAIFSADPTHMVVQKEIPFDDIQGMIEYEGTLTVGATGGANELAAKWIADNYDVDWNLVIYDGGGPGRAAFLGGHIDAYVSTVFANLDLIDNSKPIATWWFERSKLWPDTPTAHEQHKAIGLDFDAVDSGSIRLFGSNAGFKKQYPERWERVKEGLEKVHHSEAFLADAEGAELTPILTWITGEDMMDFLEQQRVLTEEVFGDSSK